MKKGDVVKIMSVTMSGEQVVEGEATLVRKIRDIGNSERWVVHFLNDSAGENYERNILNCK